jgi:transcriptional regulator with XRE-family HTH domain
MNIEPFGIYIRKVREEKGIPLRKVAAFLDIDTSTLSKVERQERYLSLEYLTPLSKILDVPLREVHIKFICDKIEKEVGSLEYLDVALDEIQKNIRRDKK